MNSPIIIAENVSKVYQLSSESAGGGVEDRTAYHNFTLRNAVSNALGAAARAVSGRWKDHRREDNQFWALKNLSFEVERGEVVGLVGRNGAGKSTLLKILSRIVEPTEGSIRLRGRIASLLEVGTGFHPELTGRENIYLNGAILGMRKAEIDRNFDEIVAFSEVEKFLDTPVKRYSSGMYVRLAFAVAAHLEPEILIVDEVLAVGDFAFQKKCLGKMHDVAASHGRTVLFVSHNMGALAQLCNRAIFLEDGSIKMIGPVNDVIKSYMRSGLTSSQGRVHFPNDPAKIGQYVSVEFRHDDGTVGASFSNDESVVIRATYEVRKPVATMSLGLSILNLDGTRVIFSNVRDSHPEIDAVLTEGRHTFEVAIPPMLLAPTTYSVTLSAVNEYEGIVDQRQNCGEFTLRDFESQSHRPGILGVRLPWTILPQADHGAEDSNQFPREQVESANA